MYFLTNKQEKEWEIIECLIECSNEQEVHFPSRMTPGQILQHNCYVDVIREIIQAMIVGAKLTQPKHFVVDRLGNENFVSWSMDTGIDGFNGQIDLLANGNLVFVDHQTVRYILNLRYVDENNPDPPSGWVRLQSLCGKMVNFEAQKFGIPLAKINRWRDGLISIKSV